MNSYKELKERLQHAKRGCIDWRDAEIVQEAADTIDELVVMLKNAETEKADTDKWIPVSERLPEDNDYILLSLANYVIAGIGRYDTDDNGNYAFYGEDSDEPLSKVGLIVNAWRPLPRPYRRNN